MLVRLTTRMDFVMQQWCISDLHLGRVNVLKFRSQFQTIDQHINVTCEKLDYNPISLEQIKNLTSTRELL